ncbi:MAG: DUF5615 family PIN-like protein [Rhizonema sp. PD37]|nr:DUF5615 family PIN-like protein [Rhizonema sp. PD37]
MERNVAWSKDEEVLAFAVSDNRAVITLNRQDFIRLRKANPRSAGIISCKNDTDRERMTIRINEALAASEPLPGKLIRVVRPAS